MFHEMIEKNEVLSRLPEYQDKWFLVTKNQEISDIINEMMEAHRTYAPYYDRIAFLFYDPDIDKLCDNLFSFVQKNIRYEEESDKQQTTKLPSGMLLDGKGDCKHYASFIAGVLGALKRAGCDLNYCYRFASYRIFDKEPHHVFVVVFDKDEEHWIDPVPGADTKEPIWILDKKPNDMSVLRNIAGVDQEQNIFDSPDTIPFYWEGQWHFQNEPGKIGGTFFGDLLKTGTAAADTSLSVATGGGASGVVSTIVNLFSSIFGGSNPNYRAAQKVYDMFPLPSGASAEQIFSQIQGITSTMDSEWFKPADSEWKSAFADILNRYGSMYGQLKGVTFPQVSASEMYYGNGAEILKRYSGGGLFSGSLFSSGTGSGTGKNVFSFLLSNPVLLVGVGAGLYLLLRKKKKVSGIGVLPLLAGAAILYFVLKKNKPNVPDSEQQQTEPEVKELPEVVIQTGVDSLTAETYKPDILEPYIETGTIFNEKQFIPV